MKQYEGTLAISLKREDGQAWPDEYADLNDTGGCIYFSVAVITFLSRHIFVYCLTETVTYFQDE